MSPGGVCLLSSTPGMAMHVDQHTVRRRSTMADLTVTTTMGAEATLKEAAVEELKARLRGELLRPSDDGYDAARTLYNAMIHRRPALIARCTGAADVIAGVQF